MSSTKQNRASPSLSKKFPGFENTLDQKLFTKMTADEINFDQENDPTQDPK